MNNILLSNLIKIRWIAIIGQFTAILLVYYILEIKILIAASLSLVFFSIIINFVSYFLQKIENKISDKATFIFLFYDTFQLSFLLYLTGGIFNPFSIN